MLHNHTISINSINSGVNCHLTVFFFIIIIFAGQGVQPHALQIIGVARATPAALLQMPMTTFVGMGHQ